MNRDGSIKPGLTHVGGPGSIPGAGRKKGSRSHYQTGHTFEWVYKPRVLLPLHPMGK